MTFRDTCFPGGMIEDVGARDAFGRAFVTGTRREAAAEGGGRINPFPGLGGGAKLPELAGFRRGGLDDLFSCGGRAGGAMESLGGPSAFGAGFSANFAGDPSLSGSIISMRGALSVC